MSWALQVLELDASADERAIKRAYAKRLRVTRPDGDPEAFQQLHEAYQAALQWARERAHCGDDALGGLDDAIAVDSSAQAAPLLQAHFPPPSPESPDMDMDMARLDALLPFEGRPAPSHGPVHTSAPMPIEATPNDAAEPALDLHRFARLVVDTATDSDPDSFERWLATRQELWSLTDKQRIGDTVLQILLRQGAPVCAENFDLLDLCFCWNEIGSDIDPFEIHLRREQLHHYWRLQPHNHAALVACLDRPEAPVSAREARVRMERLTRPWHRLEALWTACMPGRVETMRRTLELLGVHYAQDVLPPLNPDQVAFWQILSQPRKVTPLKMQLGVLRSILCALILLLVLGALALADDPSRPRNHGMASIGQVALYGGLAVLIGGSLLLPLGGLMQWQCAPEHPRQHGWLPRLLLVPLLAIGALLLMQVADARLVGGILAWATLLLAAIRLWARSSFEFELRPWMALLAIPMVKIGALALMIGEVAAVLAMAVWTIDAVIHARPKPEPRGY